MAVTGKTKLDSISSRRKLEPGKRYWQTMGNGLALGYRRALAGPGSWSLRLLDPGSGRYVLLGLGEADDSLDADDDKVLDYRQAVARATREAESYGKVGRAHGKLTVADVAKTYLEWFKEHRKSYRATEITVNAKILPTLADKRVAELTARDIRAWHDGLATSAPRRRTGLGRKPVPQEKPTTDDAKRARKATANRNLSVLKAMLNKAFEDGLVKDDSPWRQVKPFGNVDQPVVRFLTSAEAARLVNACDPSFRPLVKAALFTGARYGELAAITAADVDLGNARVFIKPGKSGKGRHVPLTAAGVDFFRGAIGDKRGNALLFVRKNGEAWGKNLHVRPLQEACAAAGIEPAVTFHELRHTYASLLAQSGCDLLTISKLLGHADTRITARHYAHLCDKTLAAAVEKHLPDFGHELAQNVVTFETAT